MSFRYRAIGTRADVLHQLSRSRTHDGAGVLIRDALTAAFTAEPDHAADGHEMRYHVDVSGHSGGGNGSPLALTVKVEGDWVPAADPADLPWRT
jgi:hypothetical protein